MTKCKLKWSQLNADQRTQVKQQFNEELKKKELHEHNLNTRLYNVNPLNGKVIFLT